MRRLLLLALIASLPLSDLAGETDIAISIGTKTISIGEDMESVVEKMGVPSGTDLLPWEYNHDYDTNIYIYDNVRLYFYTLAPQRLQYIFLTLSDRTTILVNGNELLRHESKRNIELKLGKTGNFLLANEKGNHVYEYGFKDFLSIHLFFNGEHQLEAALLGYLDFL